MKYDTLINASKSFLEERPVFMPGGFSPKVFATGAAWMADWLRILRNKPFVANASQKNFTLYGIIKYFISFLVFAIAAWFFYTINPVLVFFAVPVFYLVEVHFLFLFPLLLDDVRHPFITSIKHTYKNGLFRVAVTVMKIGIFMMAGLFNRRAPFRNWHIGCLAVLIWYQYEVRDRI